MAYNAMPNDAWLWQVSMSHRKHSFTLRNTNLTQNSSFNFEGIPIGRSRQIRFHQCI